MGEYEVLAERYWQGKAEYLGEKATPVTLFRHKPYINGSGIESGPPQWKVDGNPPELWYGCIFTTNGPIKSQQLLYLMCDIERLWITSSSQAKSPEIESK